ncbi:hypothetical protein D8674_003404 [Pyrus ussuriensis x Pyrus communis]|uniref:Uncharacterized protein n=1 Tax=Pyrus ussuriensis x Pyrus communis TaxID=2448454 RepID=A0A5N5FGZ7_9ROSA|nr:hypothetical protein D8674_003404 [Pyrus ussuriensis x Pyrus communis]
MMSASCSTLQMMDTRKEKAERERKNDKTSKRKTRDNNADTDNLFPCLLQLKKPRLDQALSSRQTESSSMQVELLFRELISNWVPPPLETQNTSECDDQQWLFDKAPLRMGGTNPKTSASIDIGLRYYPYTTIF